MKNRPRWKLLGRVLVALVMMGLVLGTIPMRPAVAAPPGPAPTVASAPDTATASITPDAEECQLPASASISPDLAVGAFPTTASSTADTSKCDKAYFKCMDACYDMYYWTTVAIAAAWWCQSPWCSKDDLYEMRDAKYETCKDRCWNKYGFCVMLSKWSG